MILKSEKKHIKIINAILDYHNFLLSLCVDHYKKDYDSLEIVSERCLSTDTFLKEKGIVYYYELGAYVIDLYESEF